MNRTRYCPRFRYRALVGALLFAACGGQPESDPPSTATSTHDPAAVDAGTDGDPTNPTSSLPLLVETTSMRGLDFRHRSGADGTMRFPEMMGGGVALFDPDGDGDLDLYFTTGSGPNALYLQDENGQFVDHTVPSGAGDLGYGTGVAVGDFDNDGAQDLFVANIGPDRLYRGLGDGTFEEISQAAGISATGTEPDDWSTSAAFCDVNRDGFLDLYVVRYVVYDPTVQCTDKTGRKEYCGPDSFEDRHDVLLRNRGDGTFEDITASAGIDTATGAGLGVVCEDLDDDGWVDIYVANDGDPNQLWIHQEDDETGAIRFADEALIRGTSVNASGLQEAGMGVVAADFDNDANPDLFLTHLRDETNTLYRNLGGGTGFQDETGRAALGSASTPYTGFGTAPIDLDLDGDLDLVIANGRVKRAEPLTDALDEPWNYFAEPNQAYGNEGGTFRLLESEVRPFVAPIEIGRGLAAGDIDGDGDRDLVLNNLEGMARIYEGEPPPHHWLTVDLYDPNLGRRALGARVRLQAGSNVQIRTIQGASSYLSSNDPRAHFGLGTSSEAVDLFVRWPDGFEETFQSVPVDQTVVLERGRGAS